MTARGRSRLLTALAAFHLALAGSAGAQLRLMLTPRPEATSIAPFTPLAEYLGRELGTSVIVVPEAPQPSGAAPGAWHAELGFVPPLRYIQLRQKQAIEPLAVAIDPSAGVRRRGVIIARHDSGLTTIHSLKGKRLIFAGRDSAAYLLQELLLARAGLDPARDIAHLPAAKTYDRVALAVFNKVADAGGLRDGELEKLKGRVDLTQLRVVAYTDYYPSWTVFAAPKLPHGLVARLKMALLKLQPGTAETARVLGTARLMGFAPVIAQDFENLRQAAAMVTATDARPK